MPKPWWKPNFPKFALNLASLHVILKSADKARPSPPPIAAPWIIAIIGLVVLKILNACLYKFSYIFWPSIKFDLLKSAPAQKFFPSEYKIIDLHEFSLPKLSKISAILFIRSSSKKCFHKRNLG